MSQGPSATSYALLGLLALDPSTATDGLTGYELKQRADFTLRFYWTSPAMSQIYTELGRLASLGYAMTTDAPRGRRNTRRYRITDDGMAALKTWLATPEHEFPTLKNPYALRLLMGHLIDPDAVREMLDVYLTQLAERREELLAVRDMLGDQSELRYPALVAEWGLAYYDSEREITATTIDRVD